MLKTKLKGMAITLQVKIQSIMLTLQIIQTQLFKKGIHLVKTNLFTGCH
jgi:hypothetical protein